MLPRAILLLSFGIILVQGDSYNINNNNDAKARMYKKLDIFCYYNSTRNRLTTNYNDVLNIDRINVDLCTHLIYGAVSIDNHSGGLLSFNSDDQRNVQDQGYDTFNQLADLKSRKRDLKIFLSVNSNIHGSWSALASDPNKKDNFVKNITDMLKHYSFDGVNIDWQYPNQRDRVNFMSMMQLLKSNLRNDGKELATVLSPFTFSELEHYSEDFIRDTVDYWIIMATEYNPGSRVVASNAPLGDRDIKPSVAASVQSIINIFKENNSYKLVLLIPFYGKSYQLDNGLTEGSPFAQPSKNKPKVYSYMHICSLMKSDSQSSPLRTGFETGPDVPYLVLNNHEAIVYENYKSVEKKTSFAIQNRLGGVMAFSIDMDDHNGQCSRSNSYHTSNDNYNVHNRDSGETFPLLTAIYDTVQRGPNSAGSHSSPLILICAIIGSLMLTIYG